MAQRWERVARWMEERSGLFVGFGLVGWVNVGRGQWFGRQLYSFRLCAACNQLGTMYLRPPLPLTCRKPPLAATTALVVLAAMQSHIKAKRE